MLTDVVGAQYTIRNTAATPITLTTGAWSNASSYPSQVSATVLTLGPKQSVTIVTQTPSSTYFVVGFSGSPNIAIDATANQALSALIASNAMQVGQLLTVTNTKPLGNVFLTAASFDNAATYPSNCTATQFYLPKDGTVTLELTSASNSNWRIVSFDYPGMAAGNVAFAEIGRAHV